MKKMIVFFVIVFLSGCDDKKVDDRLPSGFNNMPRPVVIVACNEDGLVVIDSKKNLHAWDNAYYFVKPFAKSTLKQGDVLLPIREDSK